MSETSYLKHIEELVAMAHARQAQMLRLIESLVKAESPGGDRDAVNRCVDLIVEAALKLRGRVRRHRNTIVGDFLEVRFGTGKRKPVMMLGHLDTVWPLNTLASMPFSIRNGHVYGPGVLDMKSGAAMALTALELAVEQELLEQPVILLLTSDEEGGSKLSRRLVEKLALQCESVFVLEPAQGPQAAYKTARKGVGEYRIRVCGVASHSGVDFERGHSAILELARQIEKVAAFTDCKRGITVNPGVISGGTRPNVVAAEAWAAVDVRITRAADAKRVDRQFRNLRAIDPKCTIAVEGGLNRPPMERKKGTVALFRRAESIARAIGFDLQEASSGGGSDGNFTSALGIGTLDGMGAVGEGAHANHESVKVSELAPRTALLAAMLTGIGRSHAGFRRSIQRARRHLG
jgi:glutamate carboxypeptidase